MSDKKPINGFCIQKKFIKDALIELMRTKTIDRISILELCKTADVNRNTFYAHYSTPEDVLNEIENELVEEFRKFMNISEDSRSADECTDPIYFLKKNKDVHGVLIRSRSSKLKDLLYRIRLDYYKEYYQNLNFRSPFLAEQVLLYTSSGATQICEEWVNNGCQEPISEIEDILNQLRQACVDAFKDREY